MGCTSDRDPAGKIWVFLGARGSGDDAGSIGRRASLGWQLTEAVWEALGL